MQLITRSYYIETLIAILGIHPGHPSFPPQAIAVNGQPVGQALGFVVGPAMVFADGATLGRQQVGPSEKGRLGGSQ